MLCCAADQRQPKKPKEFFFAGLLFLWDERKDSLNTKGLSNSQSVEILLHQNIEELRGRSSLFQETSYNNKEPISSKISIQFNLSVSSLGQCSFCKLAAAGVFHQSIFIGTVGIYQSLYSYMNFYGNKSVTEPKYLLWRTAIKIKDFSSSTRSHGKCGLSFHLIHVCQRDSMG